MDLFVLSASLGLDITNFEGGLNLARNLLLGFGQAVINFGRDVVQTGMGFDKQMSAVQAVLGATEGTMENIERLRSFALEQARESIFTAEDTATAYYYMGMAGWKTEQMLYGLPGVMALAAASGENLKTTSDMVTDSLTAFGLGADQATHFADVLAVTATNANTDVARMQQTFKYLAPIAGALGYSVEDVALSIGLIANQGVKGSQAGTALRNVFTRLATNAGATKTQLGALELLTERLGTQFYDSENKARPWIDVLTDMRNAWQGIGEDEKNNIMTSVFGDTDPKTAMKEFKETAKYVEDLERNIKFATKKDQDAAYNKIFEAYKGYESLFEELGITAAQNGVEAASAFALASAKFGEMTDSQRMEYGKVMASLRGMPAFLAMLETGEDDFNKLKTSIDEAEGAAERMAEVRLDNLWGDVTMFNSALDVLKVNLFDQIKGPLREIVQWGTGAVNEISDAIRDGGIEEGIVILGEKIREFGEEFAPMFEALGSALAPMISTLLTDVAPALLSSAIDIGSKLGGGILAGIVGVLETSDSPLAKGLLSMLGLNSEGILGDLFRDLRPTVGEDASGYAVNVGEGQQVPIELIPQFQMDADKIEAAIEEANATGKQEIEIGDLKLTTQAAENFAKLLRQGYYDGLVDAMENGDDLSSFIESGVIEGVKSAWDLTKALGEKYGDENIDAIYRDLARRLGEYPGAVPTNKKLTPTQAARTANDTPNREGTNVTVPSVLSRDVVPIVTGDIDAAIQQAIDTGQGTIKINGENMTIENAEAYRTKLSQMFSDVDTSGLTTSIGTSLNSVDTSGLSASIGAAGAPAGSQIVGAISSKLSGTSFSINVKANVTGLPGGGSGGSTGSNTKRWASAMNVGHIFNRPTIFDYADGRAQIAGDAGPEAVIGTNSLSRLIRDSVQSAMDSAVASQPKQTVQPNYQIVLDSGVLVGELTPSIDNELAFISSWRGGGRT